jgi:hypothetical protein
MTGEEDRLLTDKERRKKAHRRRRGPYRKSFHLNVGHK